MGSILALLAIVAFSLWIVQAGTIALRMTGLDEGTSRFQAMSAFFGVGYTTNEAELIVNHPVRRRIISHLIIAGNIGLTSALGTVILTFVGGGEGPDQHPVAKVGFIAAVVVGVILVARFTPRISPIENLVKRAMAKSGYVHPTDYELMLRIREGYGIGEVYVPPEHWLVGQSLAQARTTRWKTLVIGITREDGSYEPAPTSATVVEGGDTLAIYGPIEVICAVSEGQLPDEPPATEAGPGGTTDS